MFGQKVLILLIATFTLGRVSSEELPEETTTFLPENNETYYSYEDYWLDLNDTSDYQDLYPLYEEYYYESNDGRNGSSNVTLESLQKVLPIQFLLDPLYGFSSFLNDTSNVSNPTGNTSLLPVPQPLIAGSPEEEKALYINANLNSQTSLFRVPGLPIHFNDTQTQAFVAMSNTLLLLGSFFALQSLPGRLLSQSRSSSKRRKEKRRPPKPQKPRRRPHRPRHHHKRMKHRKVPLKYRRPPPPPPVYYDDYGFYDDGGDIYEYENYVDPKFSPPPPAPPLQPLPTSSSYGLKTLSQKKLPPFASSSSSRIKNIENHQLLPPMIDLNENQSPKELQNSIQRVKAHVLDKSQIKYTTKQSFAETFTSTTSSTTSGPLIPLRPQIVPQLTPRRTVRRKSYSQRARIPIRRRLRRKYRSQRPSGGIRKMRPLRVRQRLDRHNYEDYDHKYEGDNSGFYYKDSSPFAEDPYARFPELWYK